VVIKSKVIYYFNQHLHLASDLNLKIIYLLKL